MASTQNEAWLATGMPRKNGDGIELLADPTRRRLIAAIAIRPRTPSSLAKEIGLSRPATTRQLHLLERAGLIRAARSMADRRGVVLTMDPRSHGQITAWLAGTDIGRRSGPADAGETLGRLGGAREVGVPELPTGMVERPTGTPGRSAGNPEVRTGA